MAGAASALTEPQVLAHAKRRLFPEDDRTAAYAVADTQFAADRWLADEPIPDAVRETLSPFNHVRVGSGYPDLVEYLHELHPSFTVELFLRGDESVRRRVLTPDGELRKGALADGEIYHAPTVFQLKAILFHAGVLTERGAEPARLDPEVDVWALGEPLA